MSNDKDDLRARIAQTLKENPNAVSKHVRNDTRRLSKGLDQSGTLGELTPTIQQKVNRDNPGGGGGNMPPRPGHKRGIER